MSAESGEVFCSKTLRWLLEFQDNEPVSQDELTARENDMLTVKSKPNDRAVELIKKMQNSWYVFHPLSHAFLQMMEVNTVGAYALAINKIMESDSFKWKTTGNVSSTYYADMERDRHSNTKARNTSALYDFETPSGSCKGQPTTFYQNHGNGITKINMTIPIGQIDETLIKWDDFSSVITYPDLMDSIPETLKMGTDGIPAHRIIDHPALQSYPAQAERMEHDVLFIKKVEFIPIYDILKMNQIT